MKKSKKLKICSVEHCEKPVKTKNLCGKHYQQLMTYGGIKKIEYPKDCRIPGCKAQPFKKGFCEDHYTRYYVKTDLFEED